MHRCALQSGKVDCLQELLSKGSKIEAKNANGDTAAHLAAFNGHVACLSLLIQHGCHVDVKDKVRVRKGVCT